MLHTVCGLEVGVTSSTVDEESGSLHKSNSMLPLARAVVPPPRKDTNSGDGLMIVTTMRRVRVERATCPKSKSLELMCTTPFGLMPQPVSSAREIPKILQQFRTFRDTRRWFRYILWGPRSETNDAYPNLETRFLHSVPTFHNEIYKKCFDLTSFVLLRATKDALHCTSRLVMTAELISRPCTLWSCL